MTSLQNVPAQYLKERLSFDYDEKHSTFRIYGNGYTLAEAEDSEVANAICSLLNQAREAQKEMVMEETCKSEHNFAFVLSEESKQENGSHRKQITSVMCVRCGKVLEFKQPQAT